MLELPQVLFFLFLTAIWIVGYEMKAALRPPVCAECPHCRAALAEARRQAPESQRFDPYGWQRRDDDDRRR